MQWRDFYSTGRLVRRPSRCPSWWYAAAVLLLLTGCGTTRMTDTARTATEQLLVSSAVDDTISRLSFQVLSSKKVYLDTQFLSDSPDKGYVISSLRQHLLAHGCTLTEKREEANYVVEARCGAIGTDHNDVLVGIPQMQIPSIPGIATGSAVPEIPFAKKSEQRGVAKLAVFAYNRTTGRPVWQSGIIQETSTSRDLWVLGTGPFRQGSIRKKTEFGGAIIPIPFFGETNEKGEIVNPIIPVTQPVVWEEQGQGIPQSLLLAGHDSIPSVKMGTPSARSAVNKNDQP